MPKTERRIFSRKFKLKVIERLEAGESGTALALALSVKRTIIYRWRGAWRAGGATFAARPSVQAGGTGHGPVARRGGEGQRSGGRPAADPNLTRFPEIVNSKALLFEDEGLWPFDSLRQDGPTQPKRRPMEPQFAYAHAEPPREPTSSSWLNQVERFFALLTHKKIRRGIHRNVTDLQADIAAFIEQHNAALKPFRWTKSADDILASIERFCVRNVQV